ncbi:hypothetical protein LXJ59_25115, partial [Escherichia coli]|nr:hypothetical protein [Escherichia coli]
TQVQFIVICALCGTPPLLAHCNRIIRGSFKNAKGNNRPLIIPALGGIYTGLAQFSETLLRVIAGGALVVHGSGKIANPFGAVEMV